MQWRWIFTALVFLQALAAGDITQYHKETVGEVQYNKHGVAHVLTKEGWIAINRKGQLLYKPFLYDNGPDYEQEGLLRYVENGKMGFVNAAGKKVIPAQFDFVYPFEGGTARYCNGCRSVQMGEHRMMDEKSGIWGYVDKKGEPRKK